MQTAETRNELAQQVWVRRIRPDIFAVLSQSNPGKEYMVGLAGPTCTCPDYKYRRHRCKHILAVEIALSQQRR